MTLDSFYGARNDDIFFRCHWPIFRALTSLDLYLLLFLHLHLDLILDLVRYKRSVITITQERLRQEARVTVSGSEETVLFSSTDFG